MKLKIDEFYNLINQNLKEKIQATDKDYLLSLIRVGDNPGAISYEKSLLKEAENVGIKTKSKVFEANTSLEEVQAYLKGENLDKRVNGILIFTPIDVTWPKEEILVQIDPNKDVDGLNPDNYYKSTYKEYTANVATTAVACRQYLNHLLDLKGKDVLIINRSFVIGKPLFNMLISDDATVTMAHSKTKDLDKRLKDYDIIVSAIGRGHMFKDLVLKDQAIVLDLGFAYIDGKYQGDFLWSDIESNNIKYLPPFGGIGRINANYILLNTYLNGENNDR